MVSTRTAVTQRSGGPAQPSLGAVTGEPPVLCCGGDSHRHESGGRGWLGRPTDGGSMGCTWGMQGKSVL